MKKKQELANISKGDMQAADALSDGEEDVYLSDDEKADEMSLASDLDDEDLEEVEERERALAKKAAEQQKKKKVTFTEEEEDDEVEDGGLLVELEGKDKKREKETNLWFSKAIFNEIELEGDAESELRQSQWLQNQQTGKGKKRKAEKEEDVPEEEAESSQKVEEDGDDDDDDKYIKNIKKAKGGSGTGPAGDDDDDDEEDDGFQVVPVESTSKKARILDAEGLALGCEIATSKKKARDLMDNSFHRFASSDEPWEVPEWFLNDERKHRKKPVPVTKEMVEEYKQKWREIDARPIKRVAEAKARKKKRMLKKMEQAKKKAEAVVNTVDTSEREKMAQLKSIYKKAGVGKEKRDVTYVVTKKGAGRKVRRPPGVKGVFKVVDGRMKKDLRGAQRKEQKAKGGKGKGRAAKGGNKGRAAKGGNKGAKAGKGRKGK